MWQSNSKLVKLGSHHLVEEGVVLGRPPSRDIEVSPLVIGDNAVIRSGSVLYACSSFGDGLQTGHNIVVREQNVIGDGLNIWSGSSIDYGCRIGSGVLIHCLCYIAQFTEIDDNVFLGPGTIITNDLHPGCGHFRECMRGPHIHAGAVIGGNVTILPRVTIGRRSLVAAGSVVTDDVPPETMVAGNPAVVRKSIHDIKCATSLTDFPYPR